MGSAVWVDDLTSNENERIKLSLITKPIGFVVGFVIVYFSYLFFDKDELDTFRLLFWCVFAASVFFTLGAYFALRYLLHKHAHATPPQNQLAYDRLRDESVIKTLAKDADQMQDNKSLPLMAMIDEDSDTKHNYDDNDSPKATFSMKLLFSDILSQRNLWWFIVPSVINEFQGIFLGQYRPIFVDAFLDDFSQYFRSTYIAVLSNGGVVIEVAILLISFKVGCAFFVRLGILIRLVTAMVGVAVLVVVYMAQYEFGWNRWLAVFTMLWLFSLNIGYIFFVNFFNMVMANLVYEQRAYRIRHGLLPLASMTGMYWALHAVFAKPFNGVGTIIGTYVLENAGYGGPDGEASFDELDDETKGRVQYALLHLTAWFMLASSCLQYLFFRNYDLENEKLAEVERIVSEAEQRSKDKDKASEKAGQYGST